MSDERVLPHPDRGHHPRPGLTSCGSDPDVDAPDWILTKAREEAARLGEDEPDIEAASCDEDACTVVMLGSFVDGDTRAPRLDVRISRDSGSIVKRAFNYGA